MHTCLPVPHIDVQVVAAADKVFTIWRERNSIHAPLVPVELSIKFQSVYQIRASAGSLVECCPSWSSVGACLSL